MQYVIDHHATQMAQEVLAPVPHLLFQEYLLSEQNQQRVKTCNQHEDTLQIGPDLPKDKTMFLMTRFPCY